MSCESFVIIKFEGSTTFGAHREISVKLPSHIF